MYGGYSDYLKSAEDGIRKSRKELKKIFKLLEEGYTLEAMKNLKSIDVDLLNSLSDFNMKRDGKAIDGVTNIKPDWMLE